MNQTKQAELVLLTGVSGAGKTTAMNFMEDVGYYCVDNMPPQLLATFLKLILDNDNYTKVAVAVDIRTSQNFQGLLDALEEAQKSGFQCRMLYLDIGIASALNRYKLTRRKHPLADKYNGNIETAIRQEKERLSPLREESDYVVDTTDLSPGQLKERLTEILLGGTASSIQVHCTSFGFKHGMPTEADFVLDVRCLPNPYWVDSLKGRNGLDREVIDYVFSWEQSRQLLDKLFDLADFLLPLYVKEGKRQVVFAIGCTGGCHRSVAFAEALKAHLAEQWNHVGVYHRDINK